jgi:type I restriction-modification system DNA methylase subunit
VLLQLAREKSNTVAKRALHELVHWTPHSEQDLYFYVKEFFVHVLGYPRDRVIICEPGKKGTPDISLVSADAKPRDRIYWAVGEVKQKPGLFRDRATREERWNEQLSRYITADTVYSLLIDSLTLVVLHPSGREIQVVHLDKANVDDLRSESGLEFLSYSSSIGEKSLKTFIEGHSPSKYIDVRQEGGREKFYSALRVSAQELIDFSVQRLKVLREDYKVFEHALREMEEKAPHDQVFDTALKRLDRKHQESIRFVRDILPAFRQQVGKAMPEGEEEARKFEIEVYATEGASLILARILFVRFFEDHDMVKRKISNGGVQAFREYYSYIKDDYRFLLTSAYRDLEVLCHRLFEPSIFDFASEGDGILSGILLRVFYRLNAFDFTFITGDVLGNLYERFLDIDRRKKVGEYYTPMAVAKYVLERIGFFDSPGPLLDPACGSGTFLIAALTGLVHELRKRKVALDVAIQQSIDIIHGLDINVFAAFIAQMQLTWHLFPYLKEAGLKKIPEFKVYGGVNSLIYQPQQTLTAALLMETMESAVKIRDGRYKYVVGNPPYIRNERLKDHGEWRDLYHEVDFRNSDVSFFFVARAVNGGCTPAKNGRQPLRMPSWLQDNRRMCFVLPMGLCDSEAASALRKELCTNKIIEITDLEEVAIHIFPSPQASGRATTAPVLLFIEKTERQENHVVSVVRVPEKTFTSFSFNLNELDVSSIPQSLLLANSINPYAQFLTKLRQADLPPLRKLMSNQQLRVYAISPTPTFAIKVGNAGKVSKNPDVGTMPLAKGLNISTFYIDSKVESWVDVASVADKSIWRREDLTKQNAYAISNLALCAHCSIFEPSSLAFNNSAIVFVPKSEYSRFPWDLLMNSSLVRFAHLLCLRAGLVGVGTSIGNGRRASWCHVNPRTVAAFPVPTKLVENPGELINIADKLRVLASLIANRWQNVDKLIEQSAKKSLALFNLDFTYWQGETPENALLRIVQRNGSWILEPYIESQQTFQHIEGPMELLNVAKYLLEKKGGIIAARDLQELQIPEDHCQISVTIDNARNPASPEITQFVQLQEKADRIIAQAFELSEEEFNYIQRRLSTPPLDVLRPRFPWVVAEKRGIKAYDSDRFA